MHRGRLIDKKLECRIPIGIDSKEIVNNENYNWVPVRYVEIDRHLEALLSCSWCKNWV